MASVVIPGDQVMPLADFEASVAQALKDGGVLPVWVSAEFVEEPSRAAVVVRTVADVTDDHRGWLITVKDPGRSGHTSFVLGRGFGSGVRRWTHDDVDYVGLTDDVRSPGIAGTERIYPSDTPCELVRQGKKPRRRREAS